MRVEALPGKIELIGIIAVVLSLLFVAYEVRQNTNTAAAQAVFELNEAGRQTQFMQVSDSEIAKLFLLGQSDPQALTELQRFQYSRWVFSFLNLYESAWTYHQRGIISDQELEGWKVDYCQKISMDLFRREFLAITETSSAFRNDVARWCD
jgi:hypothetical protein